jgi:hypothetical protein
MVLLLLQVPLCASMLQMVPLLLQVTLCASMLAGWFCCCYECHSMCFTVLSGWFCWCCRRLTVAGSAVRCSQTSWRTAQSAQDRAAACVSRWSRGVPSSCRGTVFLPTPHNTPASPPFCASVGGTVTIFTSRDKFNFILSPPCSPVGGRGLSERHSISIFRIKGCRVRNWLDYTGGHWDPREMRKWRPIGSNGNNGHKNALLQGSVFSSIRGNWKCEKWRPFSGTHYRFPSNPTQINREDRGSVVFRNVGTMLPYYTM